MKQKFLWLLMALCAITFAACGDDDDSPAVPGPNTPVVVNKIKLAQVVGTWQVSSESSYKVWPDGTKFDFDNDFEPDRIEIKSDRSWAFYDYDSEHASYELEAQGMLVLDANGYIIGNGMYTFTGLTVNGNSMSISYQYPDVEDGRPCVKFVTTNFTKIA